MKLNLTKSVSTLGRWVATTLFCLAAMAFVWQGALPGANLNALADTGSQIQGKVSEDAGRAKSFIREVKDEVKDTAHDNASKVDDATDDDANFLERRAKKDAARIDKRAEEDAARTQEAVDNTKNAVEKTIDNIKDAFGS